MARDLGNLTVPPRHAARPAIMGGQPAVIPPEAHGTPDPRAEEAVESARPTALLLKRGVMTAGNGPNRHSPQRGRDPDEAGAHFRNAALGCP
jgi:hypothetical protein